MRTVPQKIRNSTLVAILALLAGIGSPCSLQALKQVEWSPIPSSDGIDVFQHDVARTRLVTTAQEVKLVAATSDTSQELLLLEIGKVAYPVYPEAGRMEAIVPLKPGVQQLVVSTRSKKLLEYEVIRLENIRVAELRSLAQGSEAPIEIQHVPRGTRNGELASPLIQLSGKLPASSQQQLRARDHYNNPLVIQEDGENFRIDYALREPVSRIVLQSVFENRLFYESTLSLAVGEFLSLDWDADCLSPDMVRQGLTEYQIVSQTTQLCLCGQVPAIQNGFLELEYGDIQKKIEVVEHRFSEMIPLPENQTIDIRLGTNLMGHPFRRSFRVEQRMPEFAIRELEEIHFHGTVLRVGRSLMNAEGNLVRASASPLIKLSGRTRYEGALESSILVRETGETILLGYEAGSFEVMVSLSEGNNQLEFRIGQASTAWTVVSKAVEAEPFIHLEGMKSQSGALLVPPEGLRMEGRVPSVMKGILRARVGAHSFNLMVKEGRFSMHEPLRIAQEDQLLELSMRLNEREIRKSVKLFSSLEHKTLP